MKKISNVFLGIMMILSIGSVFATGQTEEQDSANAVWPDKSVQIIVPHGAGGDTNYNARLLSQKLEEKFGQAFVVTNVTGGNGSIGLSQVKESDPDGYTFVFANLAALSANEASGLSDYGYNAFDPVAIYGRASGEVIIIDNDSPYNSLQELIDGAAKSSEKMKFGVSMGGAVYAAAVMLKNSGAEFAIVDAGDSSSRIASVLGGHIDASIVPYMVAREYIENGDVKPVCTLMSKRSVAMPDVPTAQEVGVQELVMDTMYGALAPKGTDKKVIEELNSAILEIVREDKVYGVTYKEFNYQDPWALSIEDSIATLDDQRNHFMSFSKYLQ